MKEHQYTLFFNERFLAVEFTKNLKSRLALSFSIEKVAFREVGKMFPVDVTFKAMPENEYEAMVRRLLDYYEGFIDAAISIR